MTLAVFPENELAMKSQIGQLLLPKIPARYSRSNLPARECIAVSGWRCDELSIVREADVALIKQVIDVRTQQQSVVPIELLDI